MTRNDKEIIVSLIFVIFSVSVIGLSMSYEDPMSHEYATLTSIFVPIFWASITLGLSLIYLFTTVVRRKKRILVDTLDGQDEQPTKGTVQVSSSYIFITTVGTAILLVLYVLLLRRINFIIATFLFIFGLFSLFHATNKWWKNVIIAVISSFVMYVIFVVFMRIPI